MQIQMNRNYIYHIVSESFSSSSMSILPRSLNEDDSDNEQSQTDAIVISRLQVFSPNLFLTSENDDNDDLTQPSITLTHNRQQNILANCLLKSGPSNSNSSASASSSALSYSVSVFRVSTKQNMKKKEKDNHDHNRLQIKDMNNTNKKDLNKEETMTQRCNSRFPKCPSRRDI
ncbi:hypothetical protein RFI_00752 [Reticulomyxa filosa]|uniref:Uncharacterized protein n=1 Tax=Reticulomyxa filosa TaxID=46433 RepID=X6PCQ9_RETFI|nr:hypothetical protein RFI_00752 [Reticulomyxa filosa]|eukprot:ETO36310.1 hypothetical protein RFI_00752 [Reticulomyxa filosa]